MLRMYSPMLGIIFSSLRSLSYCLDTLWENEDNTDFHLGLEDFLLFLTYTFYTPTAIFGPPLNYQDFIQAVIHKYIFLYNNLRRIFFILG